MKKIHNKLLESSGLYSSVHENSNYNKTHWGLFLVTSTLLSLVLLYAISISSIYEERNLLANVIASEQISDDNITIPPFTRIEDYNVAILNLVNEVKLAPANKKSIAAKRINDYVLLRRDLLLDKMKNDPDSVLNGALSSNTVKAGSADAVKNLEERKKISGKFEYLVIHYGDYETGFSLDEFYLIEEKTNKRYKVYMKGEPDVMTDDFVTIDGVVLDDSIATNKDLINVVSSPNRNNKVSFFDEDSSKIKQLFSKIGDLFFVDKAEAQTSTTVKKKLAVILINWQNDTRTSFTIDSARATVFTNSNSARAYYRENSFGKMDLIGKNNVDGDVYGYVTIPYDNVSCSSMYRTWSTAADTKLRDSGVDLTGYDMKMYIFPYLSSCGWSGLGNLGGSPASSWINSTAVGTIIHEIGHNLGAHHASSWSCSENGARVSISADSNCTLGEYGDMYSVMGKSGFLRHLSNYNKGMTVYSLNWLDSINTRTLNRNSGGTYTLAPIESPSTGIQSLRIPRTIGSDGKALDYYYVEFRQPIGFDATISSYAKNGLIIRIGPEYNSIQKSKLIDTTPGTTVFDDAPLAVGSTFTDSSKAISITNVAVAAAGATVNVSFGELPCTQTNPSITMTPTSVSLYAGQSASFSYTLKNNNTSNCVNQTYSVIPTLPSGFTQSPSSISHTLASGQSVSGSIIVTLPSTLTGNSYTVTQTAQNASATTYKSSVSSSINIQSADTTPPVVIISKPSNGATISKGKVSISSTASDASGISQIIVTLNDVVLKNCYNTTKCDTGVSANNLSAGTYTIKVQAFDKAGPVSNSSSASVSVVKEAGDTDSGGGRGGRKK